MKRLKICLVLLFLTKLDAVPLKTLHDHMTYEVPLAAIIISEMIFGYYFPFEMPFDMPVCCVF